MVKYNVESNNLNVSLSGNLGTKDIFDLRKELIGYVGKGVRDISVDLRELSDIDSTGLGVLISANKLVNEKNGHMYIKGVDGHIREIFKLTRLDKVFNM